MRGTPNRKRSLLLWIVPIAIVLIMVLTMVGGNVLKQPLGQEDRLEARMRQLEQEVQHKQWKEAGKSADYAERAWHKIVNRVQFSVERENILEISGTLARVRGGVVAKDDQAILEELYFFYDLWKNLGR
ncbi:DUF4363 family protein [Paenibacillus sp. IB182496]|uniref:DUF4363 family protein n=1 Tax=Paenibacillus sabuli TaxID=2772509 RepID=A0A927BSL7_9BACL|nr:DUF4363 family protein [Paenibacillus sabuli]MBD2844930.1 DUF4363 family protein [Paenibacillus sabuli]